MPICVTHNLTGINHATTHTDNTNDDGNDANDDNAAQMRKLSWPLAKSAKI